MNLFAANARNILLVLLLGQAIAKIYRGPIIGTPTIEQWHRNFDDLREAEFDEEEAHFSFSIHELELFGNAGEPLKKIVTAFTSNKQSYELPTYYYLDREAIGSPDEKNVLALNPGDFIKEINGYFTSGVNVYNSFYYLTGLRAISNSSSEIWVGYSGAGTGMMSIEGPIVGFYGAIYFDSQSVFGGIGVFIDPSLWPTDLARSRLVKRKMLGYLFIQSNSWNYFDHYEDNDRPFSMRIVNLTIEYNEVYVYKMNITYEITREIGQSEGRYTWRSLGGDGRYPEDETNTTEVSFGNWRDHITNMIVGTTTHKDGVEPCLEYLRFVVSYSNEEEPAVMEFGQRRINMGDWTELEIERPVAFHGLVENGCIKMLGGFTLTESKELNYACPFNDAFNYKPDHIAAGTTAYFKCNKTDGKFASNDIPVVCREDGFWENKNGFPFCSRQCDVALLPDIPGQYIFDGDTILPYQTVEVECLPGYYSFGNGSIGCDADGEWNITGSVECLKECPLPLPPANGAVLSSSNNTFEYNDTVFIVCNDGYMLSGSDLYICNDTPANFALIGNSPICKDNMLNGTHIAPEPCPAPTSTAAPSPTPQSTVTVDPFSATAVWNNCSRRVLIPGIVVISILSVLILLSLCVSLCLCRNLRKQKQNGKQTIPFHSYTIQVNAENLSDGDNMVDEKCSYSETKLT